MSTDLISVSKVVQDKYGPLTIRENAILIKTFSRVNLSKYSGDPPNVVTEAFANAVIDNIEEDNILRNGNQDKAMSSKRIFNYAIKSIFGLTDIYKIQKLFNESSLYQKNYISLDTSNANADQINTKIYTWKYLGSPNVTSGSANTYVPLKNIVSMKLSPVKFNDYRTFRDFYGIFSLLIDEFSAQAYIGHENRRFHFLLEAQRKGNFLEFNPHNFNSGVYTFQTPIKSVDSFTISLADPFRSIDLPSSKQDCYMIYTNPLTIVTFLPFNLATGNTVIIKNFTTNNSIADAALINAINSPTGYTTIRLDPYKFTIPIDGTVVVDPKAYPGAYCFNLSAKSVFTLEFTTLKDNVNIEDHI
jgi:hypothetical protein